MCTITPSSDGQYLASNTFASVNVARYKVISDDKRAECIDSNIPAGDIVASGVIYPADGNNVATDILTRVRAR